MESRRQSGVRSEDVHGLDDYVYLLKALGLDDKKVATVETSNVDSARALQLPPILARDRQSRLQFRSKSLSNTIKRLRFGAKAKQEEAQSKHRAESHRRRRVSETRLRRPVTSPPPAPPKRWFFARWLCMPVRAKKVSFVDQQLPGRGQAQHKAARGPNRRVRAQAQVCPITPTHKKDWHESFALLGSRRDLATPIEDWSSRLENLLLKTSARPYSWTCLEPSHRIVSSLAAIQEFPTTLPISTMTNAISEVQSEFDRIQRSIDQRDTVGEALATLKIGRRRVNYDMLHETDAIFADDLAVQS